MGLASGAGAMASGHSSTLAVTGLVLAAGPRRLAGPLSFEVAPGDRVVVASPSGSGKTLLLRALAGLDAVQGQIALNGTSQESINGPQWRRRVRYVSQLPPVLPETPAHTAKMIQSFAAIGAFQRNPRTLAKGWGLPPSQWDQPWATLSGGESQRILLAIHLAAPPEILLLDEPTSALDPQATSAVEQSLLAYTCVWVTHDIQQAERVGTQRLELA
jgi:ABC-type iron transport system FetAB ATPase subunit